MAKDGKTTGGISDASTERPLSTKENIVWNSVGNFIYLVSQWLLTYVVVRTLGYESAGIFSLAMTLGTSFSTVALYTMRNYQVSDVQDNYSASTYLYSRYLTCPMAFLVCILFAVASGYSGYTLACIAAYMAFKTSEALSDVYQGMMQKRLRMDYIGISFAVKGVIEFAAFLAVALLTHDLLIAIVLLAISSFAIVLTYDRCRAYRGLRLGITAWRDVASLLIACLPMALYGFMFNTAGQIPRFFIEISLGAEQLGYYASIAMPVAVVQVAANFIFSPLITPMAMHLRDGERTAFARLLKKTLLTIVAIALVAFVGFYLLGAWFLELLFGESIVPYIYLLEPLVLCAVLMALAWFLSAVATVLRKLKELLVFSTITLAIITLGGIPFINFCGLNGASFILALGLFVFSFGSVVAIYREYARLKLSGSFQD